MSSYEDDDEMRGFWKLAGENHKNPQEELEKVLTCLFCMSDGATLNCGSRISKPLSSCICKENSICVTCIEQRDKVGMEVKCITSNKLIRECSDKIKQERHEEADRQVEQMFGEAKLNIDELLILSTRLNIALSTRLNIALRHVCNCENCVARRNPLIVEAKEDKWDCKTCTFKNSVDSNYCEMCETGRQIPRWDCSTCTFSNPEITNNCMQCQSAR